jgi:hypothetical protein
VSSTGRGSEREPEDRYFTRYPLALAICERLRDDGVITNPDVMMEPSAGAGAFVSAMAEVWSPRLLYRNDLDASLILPEHELRAIGALGDNGRLISLESDFGSIPPDGSSVAPVNAMIGNCPYSLAEEHVRKGISLLAPAGALVFLLPVNFLAGIKRVGGLYQEHPHEYMYVLDKRPQFVDGYRINNKGKRVKKGTDSNEYAAFVWRKERPEFEPVVRWLQWSKYLERFANKVARIEKTQKEEGQSDDESE